MNPAIIAFLWIAALATVGSLVIVDPIMGTANSLEDYGRLLIPMALLAAIVIYERTVGLKIKKPVATHVRRLFALPILVLAMNWLMIFSLTGYRSHYRWLILPLSLIFLCVGILLVHWRIYKSAEISAGNRDKAGNFS